MDNILDNLFYKEKLGIGNKTTFIKNVRERHPEIKTKDIQDYLKNQLHCSHKTSNNSEPITNTVNRSRNCRHIISHLHNHTTYS